QRQAAADARLAVPAALGLRAGAAGRRGRVVADGTLHHRLQVPGGGREHERRPHRRHQREPGVRHGDGHRRTARRPGRCRADPRRRPHPARQLGRLDRLRCDHRGAARPEPARRDRRCLLAVRGAARRLPADADRLADPDRHRAGDPGGDRAVHRRPTVGAHHVPPARQTRQPTRRGGGLMTAPMMAGTPGPVGPDGVLRADVLGAVSWRTPITLAVISVAALFAFVLFTPSTALAQFAFTEPDASWQWPVWHAPAKLVLILCSIGTFALTAAALIAAAARRPRRWYLVAFGALVLVMF